jgi:hypothetical protein
MGINGTIAFKTNGGYKIPRTNSSDDALATQRAWDFNEGWFANPVYINGDYPPALKDYVSTFLPAFTDEQKQALNGSADLFAHDAYTSNIFFGRFPTFLNLSFPTLNLSQLPTAASQLASQTKATPSTPVASINHGTTPLPTAPGMSVPPPTPPPPGSIRQQTGYLPSSPTSKTPGSHAAVSLSRNSDSRNLSRR